MTRPAGPGRGGWHLRSQPALRAAGLCPVQRSSLPEPAGTPVDSRGNPVPDVNRPRPSNRSLKEQLVRSGRAHAALVFDGDLAVAWCQYGAPAELPNINHRKEYEAGVVQPPDYRLTCFFVDKKYRRQGVAGVALQGALGLIAQAGGGVVEAYPQDTAGQKVSASHLYSATRSLFEQAGFRYDRSKGTKHSVMSIVVPDESASLSQSLLL
jgi:GNAT superfamily N-acetyltransferase